MIRVIHSNRNQRIAYYLVSSCTGIHLNTIIFSIIRRLQNIGLNFKNDRGSNSVFFFLNILNYYNIIIFFIGTYMHSARMPRSYLLLKRRGRLAGDVLETR